MNKQSDNMKKADKTLQSLDGIQKAEPQPYFFTRVKARLERGEKNVWETASSFLARPAVAFAGLCLILALNVFFLVGKDTSSVSGSDVSTVQEDDNIFAATNTSYDYETLEP